MSGRNAYFVEMIARRRLCRDPHGEQRRRGRALGRIKPILGTNPIAFAVADRGGPLSYLDMGTSAFMATELQLRVARNESPARRRPRSTRMARRPTDPAAAQGGGAAPFSGYKGFGFGADRPGPGSARPAPA